MESIKKCDIQTPFPRECGNNGKSTCVADVRKKIRRDFFGKPEVKNLVCDCLNVFLKNTNLRRRCTCQYDC